MKKRKLGVNIDHVATLRQARHTRYPDPLMAALLAQQAGADQITIHLREDRRHIQERDLRLLKETLQIPLNLEMAATEAMVKIACQYLPERVTLVPERRQELTTEGGLDLTYQTEHLQRCIEKLSDHGIEVSLFIDAEKQTLQRASRLPCSWWELHTGHYANTAPSSAQRTQALFILMQAAVYGKEQKKHLALGHGLTLENVQPLVEEEIFEEYNIGHSIVADALMVGFEQAVKRMRQALNPQQCLY